jgi:hypothetical protein
MTATPLMISPADAATIALGNQTIGANVDNNSAGSAEAFQASASASGSVASLTLFVDGSSSATTAIIGLYTDSSGQPGSLLTSGTITSPIAGAWNTVNVPSAAVTAGSNYWISVLSPVGTGTLYFRDTPTGTTSENSSQTTLGSLPSTWSPGAKWGNSPISAYATLAATGPALSVSPASVSMSGTVGGANPPAAYLTVSNAGAGSLTFTAASDSAWLAVGPSSGTAPQTLSVTASISGLVSGTYTGHVTVTAAGASGSPQVVPVSLSVTQPVTPGQGDWPTIEHDPGRSGTATGETQLGSGNAASLTQAWSDQLDGKVTAQPLYLSGVQVGGGTHNVAIAATNQNTVYAIDADSGTILWSDHIVAASPNCSIPGGLGISSTPVVDRASGRIFAVTDDGDLRTLSLANGTQLTAGLPLVSNPATNNVWGGLTFVNGTVYFPTGSNGCDQAPWQGGIFEVGVSGATPQLLKHWITVPSLSASTAGGGIWGYGGVSVDPSTGHVYAASSDTATNLTGNEGYTPYAGSLLALDQSLNLLGWYQPPQPQNYTCGSAPPCDQDFAATPLPFSPPGCPTMVAAGNKDGSLYITSEATLEADTGYDGSHVQAIQLNNTLDDLGLGGLFGTPLYDPATNMLYVTDSGSGYTGVSAGLVALSAQSDCTLKVAWSRAVGTAISNDPISMPTLANGVIYVGVNDGSVQAFSAASGAPLWNSGAHGFAVYAAPIVANGKVLSASWDGAAAGSTGTIRAWAPVTVPALGVTPGSLSYSGTTGGTNPAAQTVALTNNGGGALTFTATSDSSWLTVSPTSGNVPNTLSVQANMSGLTAGTYHGNVTITPSQGSPQTIPVTLSVAAPPTVPGPPTGVSAQPGNASALVSWTAPANGGSPITSYTVTADAGSTAVTSVSVTGNPPATSTTVANLTSGTPYTFIVTATNGVGTGPPSGPSPAVTPTATTQSAATLDANVSVNGTGSPTTTAAFSTAHANETLVAFVATDGPSGSGSETVTVSGAGLTWTLVGRANTQPGTAEVWTATAPAILSSVTVTSREARTSYPQMLTVMSFANSSGVGAVKAANATSGAPTATLTTTKANSLVYGVGSDWDNAQARTAGPNQTVVRQWVATSYGDTFWVQDQTNPVATAGTATTINDTGPTNDRWDLTAVEIEGANAAAPTVPAAPTGVSAQAGNASALVSWTAPANGGSPISSYTVTAYAGSTAITSVSVTGNPPATSTTVASLTNGTPYDFVVTATNGVGTGPPSGPSPTVTPIAATVTAPSLDPATPAATPVPSSVPSVTSPSFSPPAGTVVYAVFSMDSDSYTGQVTSVSSITNTGTALTWNLLGRSNDYSSVAGGFLEVWWAYNPASQSGITATANFNEATKAVAAPVGDFQILVVDHAASVQSSAAWSANDLLTSADNAPTATVTTTAAQSLVFAVFDNWNNSSTPTPGPNQSIQSLVLNTTDVDGYWVQVQSSSTPVAATMVQMSATDPGPATQWRALAWEVLAAG